MDAQFTYGNKEFKTQKELFDFLFVNKKTLLAQKKAVMKKADCFTAQPVISWDKSMEANKESQQIIDASSETLKVGVIINTTNFLDAHGDVHIPGLWTKSLMENKMIMHLQEHEMEFEKIISDGQNLKAYTRSYTWNELGFPYEGMTEALVFDSTIEKKRNEFMLNQYKNGWVRNHSVGMYYVKCDMAINDEIYPNEYSAWQKYYPQVANKDLADEKGYFWYVLEAKCIEGSAVPIGSNSATPTMTVEGVSDGNVVCESCGHKFNYMSIQESGMGYVFCPECNSPVTQSMKSEPLKSTRINNEPDKSTPKSIDYDYLLTHLKN